mmetsp:Transcript_8173/g.17758  ORF Transcript_8173/g.17758 Transcript_8173/m.17758 type:complete len:488 (-) Transcript_8173:137-1600(-)
MPVPPLPPSLLPIAWLASSAAASFVSQSLDAPYYGQHVGLSIADLNGDGLPDLLFAAGRHWIDQPYALINLGPKRDDSGRFDGLRLSPPLPVGDPGGYYQIDAGAAVDRDGRRRTEVLLAGGTCHETTPNDLGSCEYDENTPARVLRVTMDVEGCSARRPEAECVLEWREEWRHPDPRGDRNGGFVAFGGEERSVVLVGQGGVEIFARDGTDTFGKYTLVYHLEATPENTDPFSDLARYAGFAAGNLRELGGVVFAGRRTDYDPPEIDADGKVVASNQLVYGDGGTLFNAKPIPYGGEPYSGNATYSLQSTGFALDDVDGDGLPDLLEATFLYEDTRVPEYPLPQRVHFLDARGDVRSTLDVWETGPEDAGRSVSTGQIYSDSALPDVAFASAEGVLSLFANLGVDEDAQNFMGLELRHQVSLGEERCQIRNVAVADLVPGWVGVVCAVTCADLDTAGRNRIFYIPKGSEGGLREATTSERVATEVS